MAFFHALFNSKLSRTLIAAFMMLAVPLLVIGVAINIYSVHVTREQIRSAYRNTLMLTAKQFRDRLTDLEMIVSSFTLDDSFVMLCISDHPEKDLYEYAQFRSRMRAYIDQRIIRSNITLFLPKQGWIISSSDGVSCAEKNTGFPEYRARFGEYGKWGIRRTLKNAYADCVSVVYGYMRENQTNGIFMIEISQSDALANLSPFSGTGDILNSFLFDEHGIVFAFDKTPFESEALLKALGADADADADADAGAGAADGDKNGFKEQAWRIGGGDYRLMSVRLSGSNLSAGIIIDEQAIIRPIFVMQAWMAAVILVFLFAAVLYAYISYRQITDPIGKLQTAMKKVEAGDFTARAGVFHKNELGAIANSFNLMVGRIDELIMERYVTQIHLSQAQLKFLRAQINPHFLYNSLFTLYTLIKNEDTDAAADLAVYLGKYFQINTRGDENELPLCREVESVKLLLKIQNMRLTNRIRLIEEIEAPVGMVSVPSLSLMTIAENFITHGMKDMIGEAVISIKASSADGIITITVSDTGVGAPDERILEIQRLIDGTAPDQTNVNGLQNVAARLKLLKGDTARLTVSRNKPSGSVAGTGAGLGSVAGTGAGLGSGSGGSGSGGSGSGGSGSGGSGSGGSGSGGSGSGGSGSGGFTVCIQFSETQSMDAQSMDAQNMDAQNMDAHNMDAQSMDAQNIDAGEDSI